MDLYLFIITFNVLSDVLLSWTFHVSKNNNKEIIKILFLYVHERFYSYFLFLFLFCGDLSIDLKI